MQYKCEICNDTGSRDKSGDYLDCGHCDAAMQRKALNDWLASQYHQGAIAKVDSMDAWMIHQRALAMAPKAIKPLKGSPWPDHDGGAQLRWVTPDGEVHGRPSVTDMLSYAEECFKTDTADGYHGYPKDVRMGMIPELRKLFVQTAAPAAANGAMPELPASATMIVESDLGHRAYTADQMRAYGQACHAIGRGAAVREYVENGTFKHPAAAAGPDATLPEPVGMYVPAGPNGDKYPVWHRGQILDYARAAVLKERQEIERIVRMNGISPNPIDDPHPDAELINGALSCVVDAIRNRP